MVLTFIICDKDTRGRDQALFGNWVKQTGGIDTVKDCCTNQRGEAKMRERKACYDEQKKRLRTEFK